MNQPFFICTDLADQLPPLTEDTIVSRVVYKDEQMRAILFGFAAGQELSEHSTPLSAVLHFLQGDADLTLGDEKVEAKAGTWVHIVPNLKHSVYAKTDTQMMLLMLKATV